MKTVQPLRNEADYQAALAAITPYFDEPPALGTPQADHFDLLALVIGAYEANHYPVDPPDVPDCLRTEMDERGLSFADLAAFLGGEADAEAILERRQYLTLPQAWRLQREWNLPVEALFRPYALIPSQAAQ